MLDENTAKIRDRKIASLHHSINKWIWLNSGEKKLLKLNKILQEKGKIFQKYFKLKEIW